ncbi:MAG TPA: hypothetical protein VMW49_07475 [Candidatus Dormibacteraeota bacterium]|nr:hypothetical protein [Candidatus Dormibacteraeota bacterium]
MPIRSDSRTPLTPPRQCARMGCQNLVHKRTARYCSVRCSSLDPTRRARLRAGARRGRVLPMAHQLTLNFDAAEADLAALAMAREDVPAGLARLVV